MKSCICTLLLVVLVSLVARSQQTSLSDLYDDPYDTKSFFLCGFNYLSNNVYLGRKDTTLIPYYSPYIGYHFSNGIYVKGMASYTTAQGGLIDLATLEAGWDHAFSQYFNGGINADRFFYNKNSLSIRASTKFSSGIFAQVSNDYIEPMVKFDIDANAHSTDYVFTFQLDHDFDLANETLHLVPAVEMSAGTQNYYDEYFVARINKKAKKDKLKSVITNPNNFAPLVYEFSFKGSYRTGKWLFELTPKYDIPLSPATITINKKTTTETLSNTFFLELDICHR